MNTMRRAVLAGLIGFTQAGCSALWAGAGAAGATTAYEAHSKYELNRLNDDYESGKITKDEYEARKKQVEKGSLIY
jgi:hypothetical protein